MNFFDDPDYDLSRRSFLEYSAFGLAALGLLSKVTIKPTLKLSLSADVRAGYPAIADEVVAELVGAAHFNLERVEALVNRRPELARANWDWGFGDWESALGAASHVGRRDIANYLLSKGARANIFTFAMLGKYKAVKAWIEAAPGIQTVGGPHGFSLLHHARVGLRMEAELSTRQKEDSEQLIAYLEGLGNAAGQYDFQALSEDEKAKYLGDYRYGAEEGEGFSVKLNMRKMLAFGKIGAFGGALYYLGDHRFTYNGAPSVTIQFHLEGEQVTALTVKEPSGELRAKKVS